MSARIRFASQAKDTANGRYVKASVEDVERTLIGLGECPASRLIPPLTKGTLLLIYQHVLIH